MIQKKNMNLINPKLKYICPLIMDSFPKIITFCYKHSNITSNDIFLNIQLKIFQLVCFIIKCNNYPKANKRKKVKKDF